MKQLFTLLLTLSLLACINKHEPLPNVDASAIVESMKGKDISEIYKKHRTILSPKLFHPKREK